jgi:hypothetical protein
VNTPTFQGAAATELSAIDACWQSTVAVSGEPWLSLFPSPFPFPSLSLFPSPFPFPGPATVTPATRPRGSRN